MQPSHTLDARENHAATNDEIDLLALIRAVFRTWKAWVIALVVVSALFGAFKALELIKVAQETTFNKPIRLTFPNAQKLLFPSGAKFAYSDIVAPAVAQTVFERNKLEQYDLTPADLQGGLSAIPYSPTYPFIIERYNRLLSDKKLTPDHVAKLQERLAKELEQATTGETLISLRLQEKELPENVAIKILNDIPAIWAERAINEKGVLQVSAQLATANALNAELILREDALIAGDILKQKITLLKNNITALNEYEGAQSIRDPKSGMRLMDLNYAVDDLNQYVIGNLLAPVRLLGLSNTPKASAFYFEDKINRLKIKLVSVEQQAASIKDINSPYLQFERTSTGLPATNTNNSQSATPQISSDIFDKLVDLSVGESKETYKQKINDDWIALTKEIADLESSISEAQRIYAALQKAATQSSLSDEHKQYVSEIKTALPSILDRLKNYFEVSERIHYQLSAETVGVRDQLYIPIIDGVMVQKTTLDIKSTILTWIALMFLTTVIVVPGCMIRNALKEKSDNE